MLKLYHGGDILNINDIGSRIKSIRKENGLTQEELGNLIGKKTITIRKYENGSIEIPNSVLHQIANVLNVNITELYGFVHVVTGEKGKQLTEFVNQVVSFSKEEQEMNDYRKKINDLLFNLNKLGFQEAYKRIEELTRLDEYKTKKQIKAADK